MNCSQKKRDCPLNLSLRIPFNILIFTIGPARAHSQPKELRLCISRKWTPIKRIGKIDLIVELFEPHRSVCGLLDRRLDACGQAAEAKMIHYPRGIFSITRPKSQGLEKLGTPHIFISPVVD